MDEIFETEDFFDTDYTELPPEKTKALPAVTFNYKEVRKEYASRIFSREEMAEELRGLLQETYSDISKDKEVTKYFLQMNINPGDTSKEYVQAPPVSMAILIEEYDLAMALIEKGYLQWEEIEERQIISSFQSGVSHMRTNLRIEDFMFYFRMTEPLLWKLYLYVQEKEKYVYNLIELITNPFLRLGDFRYFTEEELNRRRKNFLTIVRGWSQIVVTDLLAYANCIAHFNEKENKDKWHELIIGLYTMDALLYLSKGQESLQEQIIDVFMQCIAKWILIDGEQFGKQSELVLFWFTCLQDYADNEKVRQKLVAIWHCFYYLHKESLEGGTVDFPMGKDSKTYKFACSLREKHTMKQEEIDIAFGLLMEALKLEGGRTYDFFDSKSVFKCMYALLKDAKRQKIQICLTKSRFFIGGFAPYLEKLKGFDSEIIEDQMIGVLSNLHFEDKGIYPPEQEQDAVCQPLIESQSVFVLQQILRHQMLDREHVQKCIQLAQGKGIYQMLPCLIAAM